MCVPRYRFRVLHGSEWQDTADKVDNSAYVSKKYAITDDQESLQEGAGAILFPPQMGVFPETAF
jgi:hypothetical protein